MLQKLLILLGLALLIGFIVWLVNERKVEAGSF